MVEAWTFTLSLCGHLPQEHLSECSRGAAFVPDVPVAETILTPTKQSSHQKGEAVWGVVSSWGCGELLGECLSLSMLFLLPRC